MVDDDRDDDGDIHDVDDEDDGDKYDDDGKWWINDEWMNWN